MQDPGLAPEHLGPDADKEFRGFLVTSDGFFEPLLEQVSRTIIRHGVHYPLARY